MPAAPVILYNQTVTQSAGSVSCLLAGQRAGSRTEPLSQVGLFPSFTPICLNVRSLMCGDLNPQGTGRISSYLRTAAQK